MMKDVGDGEIVAEGGDDQGDSSEQDCSKGCDSGATSGFAHPFPVRVVLKQKRQKPAAEGIST